MLSRMCGSVSFGFVVSCAVRVVSRMRVPGSSADLFDAQPPSTMVTAASRISRFMDPPLDWTEITLLPLLLSARGFWPSGKAKMARESGIRLVRKQCQLDQEVGSPDEELGPLRKIGAAEAGIESAVDARARETEQQTAATSGSRTSSVSHAPRP
jgi:hypothetical protein